MRKLKKAKAMAFILFLFTINSFAQAKIISEKASAGPQKKISAVIKKWRRVKSGMPPNQIKRILGRPKLMQNNSDSSKWYYQCSPKDSNDLNQQGMLIFRAKSLETLIDESAQKRDQKISQLKKQCELAIEKQKQSCERKVAKEKSKKATYKKVPIKRHYAGKRKTSEGESAYKRTRKYRDRYKTVQTSKAGKSETQVRNKSEDVLDIINRRFQKSIKLEFENHNRRIKRLKESPRKPEYYLVEFTDPDWSDLKRIFDKTELSTEENDPNFPWKNCLRWKNLKINMPFDEVKKKLGEPAKMKIDSKETKLFYGNNPNYGILNFSKNDKNKAVLLYWKEPFWLDVINSNIAKSLPQPNIGKIVATP